MLGALLPAAANYLLLAVINFGHGTTRSFVVQSTVGAIVRHTSILVSRSIYLLVILDRIIGGIILHFLGFLINNFSELKKTIKIVQIIHIN